jgi:short chain dehydrogenase
MTLPGDRGVDLPHHLHARNGDAETVTLFASTFRRRPDRFENEMPSPKVIILTGASRGMGLAMAKYLLERSHKVVAIARTAEPLEALKKQYPQQVEVLAADLSDLSVCSVIFCFSFKSQSRFAIERPKVMTKSP